ncbi:MAG: hypothetical protein LUQ71_04680 [Methanoregula sp.]|nr:hypothetical protein [Methanoregula sp.]
MVSESDKEINETGCPDKGNAPLPVTPAGKPEYEVKWDTLAHFSTGQVITGSQYGLVKEEYDIRMKDWTPGQPAGDGIFHMSGGKREQIKRFLEEKRYVVTTEYYHYILRAQGKKVDPIAISQKIQEMGLKFIWVHAVGEKGPDRTPRKMRLVRS